MKYQINKSSRTANCTLPIAFCLLLIAYCLFLSSCGNKNNTVAHEGEEHHGKHDNTSTVVLTAEQMKSIGIELGTLEKKQLTASLKTNGILKVPNQNRANATASLGGTVKNILIQTGTSVSKGQTIATISNNTFITMQEEYLSTLAKTELANAEYDRQKTLKEGNAASQKIFQQAEAELKSLQAKKSSLQKQLELIGISTHSLTVNNIQSAVNITSPINGTISNIMVNIGTYVEANNPIAEIVDNSQLHLDLYVYEKDLQKLKEGQIIHFTLTNNPGKEYDAKIYAISNTFEEHTKAVAVHATVLGNKTGLIDGMSITAIVSLENATVDAVPTNAIVNNEGQDFIFIVVNENKAELQSEEAEHKHDEHGHTHDEVEKAKPTKDETTFEKILVKKGTTDVGYSEITLLKDIPANSKIVVNGAFFILAKMTNQGEAHEH
ncbi:MAG: efflux RND transporter periplasmic adaptor subunit [Bacteroidia bacterium]|jgi:cobalt-zinc-cadmium efflux system membrane fusion protein